MIVHEVIGCLASFERITKRKLIEFSIENLLVKWPRRGFRIYKAHDCHSEHPIYIYPRRSLHRIYNITHLMLKDNSILQRR